MAMTKRYARVVGASLAAVGLAGVVGGLGTICLPASLPGLAAHAVVGPGVVGPMVGALCPARWLSRRDEWVRARRDGVPS